MSRWRYDHAGLGLTLMGGALVIGILEGITGLHLQPLVWAIPVGIVALIMGGMAFVFPIAIAAFTPLWVADQVSTHRQVKADRANEPARRAEQAARRAEREARDCVRSCGATHCATLDCGECGASHHGGDAYGLVEWVRTGAWTYDRRCGQCRHRTRIAA